MMICDEIYTLTRTNPVNTYPYTDNPANTYPYMDNPVNYMKDTLIGISLCWGFLFVGLSLCRDFSL